MLAVHEATPDSSDGQRVGAAGMKPRTGMTSSGGDDDGQGSLPEGGGVGLVWFRRDLRLGDNPALVEALSAHESIVPLFVWDPHLTKGAGDNRLTFLFGCLAELNRSLGGRLVIRSGDPSQVVPQVASEAGARAVWCAEDFGPYGARRDATVAKLLALRGVQLHRSGSPYAVAPGEILNRADKPYQVFTPFFKAWLAHGWDAPIGPPGLADIEVPRLPSEDLMTPPVVAASLPRPGEDAAHRQLEQFLDHFVNRYDELRDRPDVDGTSRLSPYLKFGCLHPRQVLSRLDPTNPAHRRYETELCWRDFYADVLSHRPDSAWAPFRTEWRDFVVDSGEAADARFEAWSYGRTGFPIVDAGMRQLLSEGWMHNRVRMIVASFLVKDLHLDWRRGAQWFMEHLVDGDLASNQHGWQWVAGTGTDAAPYFRVFNPVAQGKRFDPQGTYVRRWVPELATLPDNAIHEPSNPDIATLFTGVDYPLPIVNHGVEREEALLRYRALREK